MTRSPSLHLPAFIQCGCCEAHHPAHFSGDCRDDFNRFHPHQLDCRYGSTGWTDILPADLEGGVA